MKQTKSPRILSVNPNGINEKTMNLHLKGLAAALTEIFSQGPEFWRARNGPDMTVVTSLPYFMKRIIPNCEWQQLSPFFEFRSPINHHQFLKENCEVVVANFRSMYQSGASLPIHAGFPDCWDDEELNATALHAHISEVETRSSPVCRECYEIQGKSTCCHHGLFGKMNWLDSGKELIQQGRYRYLAILWRREKKSKDGAPVDVWSPSDLKEAGLVDDDWHSEDY